LDDGPTDRGGGHPKARWRYAQALSRLLIGSVNLTRSMSAAARRTVGAAAAATNRSDVDNE
jgi:hypothetical protein